MGLVVLLIRRFTNVDLRIAQGTVASVSSSSTSSPNQLPSLPVVGSLVLRFPTDGDRPTAQFDANEDGYHDLIFTNNHRNVGSIQGEAVMSYDSSRQILFYNHNLRSIVKKYRSGWVHGYPGGVYLT